MVPNAKETILLGSLWCRRATWCQSAVSQMRITPSVPPPVDSAQSPSQEIENGKVMAILSYIPIVGLIVSIVSLATKDNTFALYHAKQALTVWIIWIVVSFSVSVFHWIRDR